MSHLLRMLTLYVAASIMVTADAATVKAEAFESHSVYHSPQTPGYTAWCTLWRQRDGELRLAFQQVTGPVEHWDQRTNVTVILAGSTEAKTWHKVSEVPARKKSRVGEEGIYAAPGSSSFCGHAMAVLDDGTLVTGLWPAGDDKSGFVQRSGDDGKTWSAPIFPVDPDKVSFYPTNIHKLRDGSLVMMGAGIQKKSGVTPTGADMLKCMFHSRDGGTSWSQPIWLMKPQDGVCEEQDFVELPAGDLLVVARCEHYDAKAKFLYADRRQLIIKRDGEQWEPQAVKKMPIPHSGFPELLQTREGPILHIATDGAWYTSDEGKTWQKLENVQGSPYYPRAMQLQDGTIVVVGHVGGDDVYGKVDQTIVQQTFRLGVTN